MIIKELGRLCEIPPRQADWYEARASISAQVVNMKDKVLEIVQYTCKRCSQTFSDACTILICAPLGGYICREPAEKNQILCPPSSSNSELIQCEIPLHFNIIITQCVVLQNISLPNDK